MNLCRDLLISDEKIRSASHPAVAMLDPGSLLKVYRVVCPVPYTRENSKVNESTIAKEDTHAPPKTFNTTETSGRN